MDITIVSNIAIDRITNNDGQIIDSLGGPPCYCGLTAKQFRFTVNLVSNFGKDLDNEYLSFFKKKDLHLKKNDPSSGHLTTKFIIKVLENSREIYLASESKGISISDIENIKTDSWLISPILNEVSPEVLNYIVSRNDNFIMVDPQGFTRAVRTDGKIFTKKELKFSLRDVDAIKLDPDELYCVSATNDFRELQKWKSTNNIRFLIFTENNVVHMLHKDKHYWLNINKINSKDSTGAGDILSSAFTCSFIKENDPLWAFSFGVGASMAALKTRKNGIEKIPLYKYIEENASYNYNLLKYENI